VINRAEDVMVPLPIVGCKHGLGFELLISREISVQLVHLALIIFRILVLGSHIN
jgi:hypothetical protein